MSYLQWVETSLEILSALGCGVVLVLLYHSLKRIRQSSATLAFELFGVLLFAVSLLYMSYLTGHWWPNTWFATILKSVATIAVILASLALIPILPRAIAFRDRDSLFRAADELRQSKERFERALRGASSGLWEWNIAPNEVWYSPRYREMLGYNSEKEFPNQFKSWEDAVHPDDKSNVLELMESHFLRNEDFEIEQRLRTKNGEYRWFSCKGIAIRDAEQRPILMSGSIQDIHDKKLWEQSARRFDEYALQKHKMESLGELAGGVAHEFNNFLQAIGGQLQFVQHSLTVESQASGDVATALKLVEQASQVTRRLLTFSRQGGVRRQEIHPNALLIQLNAFIRPMLGHNIKLVVRHGKRLGRLLVDPISIHQAIMNLCINARDAMPGGGTLTLSAEQTEFMADDLAPYPDRIPGKYISLTVSDVGHGMSKEVQDRLFEPFFTTKVPGRGTGLGLAIVAGIAEENKGFIKVESQLGVGSTFKLWLPTLMCHSKKRKKAFVTPKNIVSSSVLYIEDDGHIRRHTARQLQERGLNVMSARDGARAVRVFKQNRHAIGIAVVDVSMPGMDGIEVFRQLRDINPELPFIFCTAYPSRLYSENILCDSNVHLVNKPFKFETLWQAIVEGTSVVLRNGTT